MSHDPMPQNAEEWADYLFSKWGATHGTDPRDVEAIMEQAVSRYRNALINADGTLEFLLDERRRRHGR